MSGEWDDDDDDLLAMLDDEDDIISNSGGDNRVASEPPKNTQPPNNNTTTDISALNSSNPFLSNDNNDTDVDNGIVDVDSNDMGGNGWDDDDLDLSDELNNISDDIKDTTTPQQQPSPTLQTQTNVVPPPPPPLPIHTNVNSNVSNINDGGNERVNVGSPMLQAHKKVLDKEIDNINGIEQQQQQQLQTSAHDQNDVNISDEWDFDDDDADIFNEDNVDLHDDNEDLELIPNPPLDLQPSPRAIQPSTSNATVFQEEDKQVSQPPPAPPVQQKLDTNPFLTNNSIGKDAEEPSLINETTTYTANNGSGKTVDNAADADGWSDEDFFDDDDDDMLQPSSSAGVPQPSTIPPPPPHPIPTPQQHLSPPIAQRTRAKTTSVARHHHHQEQEKPVQPSSQSLNPSQQRIHGMLSTYMSTLHNPNFLTNLHYTLHQHQSKNNIDGEGSNKSAASDLRTYYTTRPKLKKYTLGIELTRMDYNLILHNGQIIYNDKDVIRSYFGVSSTGERLDGSGDDDEEEIEEVSIEELLVRSANQSLLADMLVALTGSEDNNSSGENEGGLILSGPTLCMTSVAESCQFKIDLSSDVVEAVCLLAISVPFHDDVAIAQAKLSYHGNVDDIIKDGRLILARAQVSVRFRPGDGEEMNDEPTVQYTVQSITPYHTATSELITTAAISLAQDQMDPFFHDEYADVNVDDVQMIDARDRFLLSHHLADSGLLVVSDHIDRLKDAAEQHSTGFRSALRQLDGVTNVSSKLSGIREGFGLALPSAEEIEAAEREAAASHIPRPPPPPPPDAGFRFPRPEQVMEHSIPPPDAEFRFPRPEQVVQSNVQPRPPQPPPPPPQQNDAPRPLIGGLFMSGLSRLAAAASRPDDNHQVESGWGGGGGTGLTPPSSPDNNQAPSELPPTLYRRDESEHPQITQGGTTQGLANQFQELVSRSSDLQPTQEDENGINDQVEKHAEVEEDGWSDDEFDFDDELGGNDEIEEERRVSNNEMKGDNKIQEMASLTPEIPHRHRKTTIEYQEESERESFNFHRPAAVVQPQMAKDLEVDELSSRGGYHQPPIHHEPPSNPSLSMKVVPPPPPRNPNPNQPQRTFEEEFVMVLSDKISTECQEMKESGRMKRWEPLNEDPILRKRLMDVMVAQLT